MVEERKVDNKRGRAVGVENRGEMSEKKKKRKNE